MGTAVKKRLTGRLGGSVGWVSGSWFQLRSWSRGLWSSSPPSGPALTACGPLGFSLSLPLPLPLLARSLSLSLSLTKIIKLKEKEKKKTENQQFTQSSCRCGNKPYEVKESATGLQLLVDMQRQATKSETRTQLRALPITLSSLVPAA